MYVYVCIQWAPMSYSCSSWGQDIAISSLMLQEVDIVSISLRWWQKYDPKRLQGTKITVSCPPWQQARTLWPVSGSQYAQTGLLEGLQLPPSDPRKDAPTADAYSSHPLTKTQISHLLLGSAWLMLIMCAFLELRGHMHAPLKGKILRYLHSSSRIPTSHHFLSGDSRNMIQKGCKHKSAMSCPPWQQARAVWPVSGSQYAQTGLVEGLQMPPLDPRKDAPTADECT